MNTQTPFRPSVENFLTQYQKEKEAFEVYKRVGNYRETAKELGVSLKTAWHRVKNYKSYKPHDFDVNQFPDEIDLALITLQNQKAVYLEKANKAIEENDYEALMIYTNRIGVITDAILKVKAIWDSVKHLYQFVEGEK